MRQLGVVPFGKLLMLWDLPCWFLDYFDWRTLVNVYRFLSVLFLHCWLSQIDKKPIMNQNRRAGDAEFDRRNKICLQQ
jgi:hypothetical protein